MRLAENRFFCDALKETAKKLMMTTMMKGHNMNPETQKPARRFY